MGIFDNQFGKKKDDKKTAKPAAKKSKGHGHGHDEHDGHDHSHHGHKH